MARQMLADIKRGHISVFSFSKLARLVRNTRDLLDCSINLVVMAAQRVLAILAAWATVTANFARQT